MATTNSETASHASNVYLFKNGYGMIVKTFEFPSNKDNNSTPIELLDPPSNPIHGTFWIQSLSNNTSITSIRTKKTHKFVDKECCTVEDLLEANAGQDVQLLITKNTSQSNEWISGKIKSVKRSQQSPDDEDDKAMNTEMPTARTHPHFHSPTITNHSPPIQPCSLLLFETTDDGLLALSLSNVQSIRGATLKTTYQRKVFKNCLSINYKNDSGASDTGLMKFLTFGITWAPSYNLVLLSSNDPSVKKLHLSSKAVILNDVENMNVENLFCIVGFPNISSYASITDPIISEDNVKAFLDQLNQCEANTGGLRSHNAAIMSNSVRTQQMVMPMLSNSGPTGTQQDSSNEDLHLYEFKNVLLQKKERLMLPIFDIDIPYKDVYHCKINISQYGTDNLSHYSSAFPGHGTEKKEFEEVWHSIEFENLSNFVWTTAPVVITKGQQEQQFLGQDKLTYTLKGSTTFVNITKALDVRVQVNEVLSNTNQAPASARARQQTIHVGGTIVTTNYKSEEVVVVINGSIFGKVSNYSIEPKKDSSKATGYRADQQQDVQWEINVKPRQTLEIKYARSYTQPI